MSTSQYLLGAAELAVIATALGLGAYHLRALLVPAWTGALARLAEVVLGLSMLILVSEVIGALALFKQLPLVVGSVLVGLGATFYARRRGLPEAPRTTELRASPIMIGIGVAAAVLVVIHWAHPTGQALDQGMYYQDTTWYHMSFSARFDQTGHIGPLHFTDPLKLAVWFYPQNSELLHGVGIVTLDTDFLSPLINLMWCALCLLAAWCVGRPYGIGGVTVLGAAVVLDSDMMVGSQAGQAPNDVMGLFFLMAALAFLVDGAASAHAIREAARTRLNGGASATAPPAPAPEETGEMGVVEDVPVAGDPRVLATVGAGPLFMAGLAAGMGIGTKITLLATIAAFTIGVVILGGRQHWLRALGIWLGGVVITCGFWYGRNFVYALNPFPQIQKLGPIDLPGPDQVSLYPRPPHKLAEYYNDPLVWTHKLTPVLHERLGPLWPVILLVVVVALVWAFIKGGSALMRILAATGMVAGIAYIFTPLTASGQPYDGSGFDANLRYVSPVLMVGFLLLPLIPWFRHGRRPWILIGLFTILLVQGTVTQSSWEFKHHLASIGLAFLIVGVPALLVWGFRARLNPVLLVSFGLVMVIAAVALGRVREDYYLDHRYVTAVRPPLGGGFRASPEWQPLQDWGREASHQRIGVFGRASAFGQYFFYGNDLTNHVQYLGEEGNHGTFRPIYNCALWRQTINHGHYDYVVTTPAIGVIESVAPPQNLWTSADPNVRTVIQSGPAAVYKINGPLDPASCAELGSVAQA
ncbi:MAG TPA: hypothetical protein VHR38_15260 [Solirubrobacterales bacterium]|jgi:hypothetical protein|nr:hypothetical protein [Solirubrobacterales bacterium]